MCFRLGTGGGLLWTRWWTFWFREKRRILLYPDLPGGLLTSGFPIKIWYVYVVSPMRVTCHLMLRLYLTNCIHICSMNLTYRESWDSKLQILRSFPLLMSFHRVCQSPKPCVTFCNVLVSFGGDVGHHTTPNLENHTLWAVRNCLFNVFAATFHSWRPSSSATSVETMDTLNVKWAWLVCAKVPFSFEGRQELWKAWYTSCS
jgi:hypothetical protein